MLKKHLSYANVIASLALFIALGGTAAAAVTLTRDSVGAPQIRKDGVRSPEIQADAVRSPELVEGSVRTSEIRDKGINFADLSAGAATALRGELRVAERDNELDANDLQDSVPVCLEVDLTKCPDFLVLRLASGVAARTAEPLDPPEAGRNWLIQAKLDLFIGGEGEAFRGVRCGLVNTTDGVLLDEVAVGNTKETIALSAVVKKRANNPTIALRCTRDPGVRVEPTFSKITALEVGTVTGP